MTYLLPGTIHFNRRAVAQAIWADVNAKRWHWGAFSGDVRAYERNAVLRDASRRIWSEARCERAAVVLDGLAIAFTPAERAQVDALDAEAGGCPIDASGNERYRELKSRAGIIRERAGRRTFRHRLAELRSL